MDATQLTERQKTIRDILSRFRNPSTEERTLLTDAETFLTKMNEEIRQQVDKSVNLRSHADTIDTWVSNVEAASEMIRDSYRTNVDQFVRELKKTLPQEPELRAKVQAAFESTTRHSAAAKYLRNSILDCLRLSQSSDPDRLSHSESGATEADEPTTSG